METSFFETKTRIDSFILSISCFETRTRFHFFNLVFRDEIETKTIISHGRARKNQADSHDNSCEREFSLNSEHKEGQVHKLKSLWINRSNNNLFSFCCKSLELNDLEIIGESICLRSLEIIAEDRFETFLGSFSEELHVYIPINFCFRILHSIQYSL